MSIAPSAAGLRARILDAPPTVPVSSVLLLTFAIENDGPDLEVYREVDLDLVQVSVDGSPFHRASTIMVDSFPDPVRALQPGERRLYQEDMQREAARPATLRFRIRLAHQGTCRVLPPEAERLGVKVLEQTGPPMLSTFACWEGELISDPVTVMVTPPLTDLDESALRARVPGLDTDYQRYPLHDSGGLVARDFPESFYAPVGALYSRRPATVLDALDRQPTHPLAAQLRAAAAVLAIRQCRVSPRPPKLFRVDSARLGLTDLFRAYVEQVRREEWTAECDELAGDNVLDVSRPESAPTPP